MLSFSLRVGLEATSRDHLSTFFQEELYRRYAIPASFLPSLEVPLSIFLEHKHGQFDSSLFLQELLERKNLSQQFFLSLFSCQSFLLLQKALVLLLQQYPLLDALFLRTH